MVKTVFILGSILLGGAAHASQLTCTGEIAGYNMVLRAKMQGSRFVSKANLVVTKNGAVLKQLSMHVNSSKFVVRRSLYFTASGKDGNIVVNTAYSGGHNYSGSVDATGSQGNITVQGVCAVR